MSSQPLADITSHDTYVEGVPHEEFARRRREDPVSWTEEHDGGRGFWSLTKHEDILFASRKTEYFSSAQGIRLEDMTPEETEARRTLMEMDAPEHTRLRRLVNRPFAPRAVADYEATIRELSVEILDSLQGAEEFDFCKTIARELPMKMLGRLLGLPDTDLDWLVQRGDALIGNSDPEFTDFVVDQTDTSAYALLPFRSPVALELFAYAEQALNERRLSPTHDLLTALLESTYDGDHLDELALKNFFTLMVAAGNDTTRYSIVAGMQAFLERPDLFAALPTMSTEEIKLLVDEVLRWSSTTMHFRRTVTQDIEMRDKTLRAGDKVVLWFVSGNYDEDVFEHSFVFNPQRSVNPHLAFGLQSPHLCLGAHLARLEMRVMFEEMGRAWRTIEPNGTPERLRSNFISGTKRLPVGVIWR